MTDIFQTLTNISVICAPNSQEDRTENISKFWTQVQSKGEEISQFSSRVQEFAKRINEQYTRPQITFEHIYAALISGVEKGAESKAYKKALSVLKYRPRQSNSQKDLNATVLWLHRACDRTKLQNRESTLEK